MNVRAVIFDMDGLMFDTERLAYEAWRDALADRGYVLDEAVYLRAVGRTVEEAKAVFVAAFGPEVPIVEIESDKARRLRALLDPAPPLKPGLRPLLDEVHRLGLLAAVASATATAEVRRRLAVAGLDGHFDAVIGGDDVTAGKPAPDLLLCAARRLGVEPAACVVLEDSEAGIKAAAAAGMAPVMVPDMVQPSAACRALAVHVAGSLTEVARLLVAPDGLAVASRARAER